MVHESEKLLFKPSSRRLLTIFTDEERRTGTVPVISKLGVKPDHDNRISYVLWCEENIRSLEEGVSLMIGELVLDPII